MNIWKTGALTAALVVAAGAGAAFMPAPSAQDRNREPIARALQLIGRGGQVGVTVRDVAPDDPKASGVIVEDVSKDSPAEKAGIKRDDRIVEFDGERVRSVMQFRRLVQETPEDRKVAIVLQRGSERVTANLTPQRRGGSFYFGDDLLPPAPMPAVPPRPPRAFSLDGFRGEDFTFRSGDGRLGLSVESLTDQLREYFGVKHGVLVRTVRPDSPAAKAGVKAGDVVTAVNGRHVEDPSDVSDAVRKLEGGGDLTIEVSRDRKPQTLKGKLD